MSVINQMLMDLEKRRASGSEGAALPNQVRPLPRLAEESGARSGALFACVAAVVVVAALLWWLSRQNSPVGAPAADAMNTAGIPTPVVMPALPPAAKSIPMARSAGPRTDTKGLRLSPTLSVSPGMAALSGGAPAPVTAPPAAPLVAPGLAPGIAPPVTAATTFSVPPTGAMPVPAAEKTAPRSEPGPAITKTESLAKIDSLRPETAPKRMDTGPGSIDKQTRPATPRDRAEADYRRATAALNQGRVNEAIDALRAALAADAGLDAARQTLVGVLIEQKRTDEAQKLLQDALASRPNQLNFATLLARMQLDRGDNAGAIASMSRALPYAGDNADFLGFSAALLQRVGRHAEAADQYRAALRLRPDAAIWWMGLGISLQASERGAEALDAYRRALSSGSMSPELQAFVEQRIKQLAP